MNGQCKHTHHFLWNDAEKEKAFEVEVKIERSQFIFHVLCLFRTVCVYACVYV